MRVNRDKAFSLETAGLVTIIVGTGSKAKSFSVHKSYFCDRAEFFRRAMNGRWAESNNRTIKLPHDDPEIFGTYINLVYTGEVASGGTDIAKNVYSSIAKEYIVLAKLYVLSEKLYDVKAKNATLDAIMTIRNAGPALDSRWIPSCAVVNIIHEGTHKGSPGRKLMADLWSRAHPRELVISEEYWPCDFLLDLSVTMLKEIREYDGDLRDERLFDGAMRAEPEEYHEVVEV